MGQIRDAARTRNKIVAAAKKEFAARGLAGARIESIARRAKLTKQLLYHYFPGKEALFDEILEHAIQERKATADAADDPRTMFSRRFAAAAADPVWVRFLTWEAAEFPSQRRITRREIREETIKHQTNAILARQFRGRLPQTIKAELLQLAIFALATYPLAFAQITEMVTGMTPDDPAFQSEWSEFLDQLGALVASMAKTQRASAAGR
jgi:TetR/AcrR family transcriptional regulator